MKALVSGVMGSYGVLCGVKYDEQAPLERDGEQDESSGNMTGTLV
jgi:hypothetical protein